MADNVMGSLADQSTYDPATGMPYPGNAPDYGDLSQRMTNAQQRIAAGIYEAGAMPGRAFGTVPGGPPTPEEEANWGAGTAFGMLGAGRIPGGAPAGAVGAGGAKLVQPEGIFAYHSSPYTFDKFDMSKIGTGEGAQVYGHGIYAAENPAVSGQGGQYWQQFTDRFRGPEGYAAERLYQAGFDRAKAAEAVQNNLEALRRRGSPEGLIREQEQTLDLLRSGNPVGPRTYEVNINVRPEQMLNWDAPLAQQPSVSEALAGSRNPIVRDVLGRSEAGGTTGENLYKMLSYDTGLWRRGAGASQALSEAGIPGIRYLDQGSRNKFWTDAAAARGEKPTHNYVIFDPNKLDIRKMYAVPGAVGAGAAGMGALATQDNYQPQ